MSSLPPELAAWATVLAGFAPDLAEPVGLLARRLELVIGRVRARPRPHGDDPDGYDGLDRRGPYDRLVLSEWALAEAVPEEFDRRAASGEQSFLRLDRRDRKKGVRCVALFDGGPSQLGGPRVVQLAALVVLWRRALASGADFTWGTVHGGVLQERVDRATIQAFLGARTGKPASAEDIVRARANVGDVDELWLIGPPAPNPLVALAPTTGQPVLLQLSLAEVVALDVRAVDVRLTRGGGPLGEVRLDLPAPAITRRLLVDPFPEPAVAVRSPSLAPAGPPPPDKLWRPFPRDGKAPLVVRFVPGTTQLVALLSGGLAFAWGFDGAVLRSPKPKQTTLGWDEPLVALGYHQQRTITITRTKDGDYRPSWYGSPILAAQVEGPPPVLGAGTLVTIGSNSLFLDVAGTLYAIDGSPTEDKRIRVEAIDVVLLFAHHLQMLYVVPEAGGFVVKEWRRDRMLHLVGSVEGDQIWVAQDVLMTRGPAGLRAWRIPTSAPHVQLALSSLPVADVRFPAASVLGVAYIAWNDIRAVTHRVTSGTLFHPGTEVTITPPRTPIDPTLSQDGTIVAWRTEEGFLEAWSFVTGAPVIQRHGA
jgi:hypothetical protein